MAVSTTQRRQLTLDEIEQVLVSGATSRRQGTTHYVLEVYTSGPSPRDFDAACSKFYGDGRTPAYHVEKSLADFDSLRRALYSASHLAHTYASCEFCKEMILYIDSGDKRFGSSVFRVLVGRDKIKRSLQEFMDDVLDMLKHFSSIEGTPWCSGQVQSHQVMRQFLLPRAPDS
ncbi:hypothetical protein PHYSODRAFT_260291 [Phytophthora sojae]|uniref:Uncharacterized protein n=1 Tax=Phytophthora sojae (strain P6497) TaxID=1094619 RepID=G4YWU8_PHYSP|nr:hypothetical protein PHYSODRAFT_260291 [Phytophthora sojae]EGZ24446.1 hypothetical protein PHYSODRAFT_260291 [Phytophthora sojae]|eukprot:XP_009519734.1 hypothetical protein PHYSODRAFT_260291 [Phytophthora sojae]